MSVRPSHSHFSDRTQENPGLDLIGAVRATLPRTARSIDPKFVLAVEAIAALGPRALAEMLLEFRERFGGGFIDARLAAYAALPAETIRVAGGDQLRVSTQRAGAHVASTAKIGVQP
jgi:hypothetical protein